MTAKFYDMMGQVLAGYTPKRADQLPNKASSPTSTTSQGKDGQPAKKGLTPQGELLIASIMQGFAVRGGQPAPFSPGDREVIHRILTNTVARIVGIDPNAENTEVVLGLKALDAEIEAETSGALPSVLLPGQLHVWRAYSQFVATLPQDTSDAVREMVEEMESYDRIVARLLLAYGALVKLDRFCPKDNMRHLDVIDFLAEIAGEPPVSDQLSRWFPSPETN